MNEFSDELAFEFLNYECRRRPECGGKSELRNFEILNAPESHPARNAGQVGFVFSRMAGEIRLSASI
jgi:phenylalanyl-tRNA synthetase alpha subunit